MFGRSSFLLSVFAVLGLSLPAHAQTCRARPLQSYSCYNILQIPISDPRDINDRLSIVGVTNNNGSNPKGALYDLRYQNLSVVDGIGSSHTYLSRINESGVAIGQTSDDQGGSRNGIIREADGTIRIISSYDEVSLNDIDESGRIVGSVSSRYTNGNSSYCALPLVLSPITGSPLTYADKNFDLANSGNCNVTGNLIGNLAINNHGDFIAGDGYGLRRYNLSHVPLELGTLTPFSPSPNSSFPFASAINERLSVAGTYSDMPVLWRNGEADYLLSHVYFDGDATSVRGNAHDLNECDMAVGSVWNSPAWSGSGTSSGFIFDSQRTYNINDRICPESQNLNLRITSANAINNMGYIVGTASRGSTNWDSQSIGVLLRPGVNTSLLPKATPTGSK